MTASDHRLRFIETPQVCLVCGSTTSYVDSRKRPIHPPCLDSLLPPSTWACQSDSTPTKNA